MANRFHGIIDFSLKTNILLILQCKDVEDQLSQRKAEVEKLIQEMREVNMESLAISPPEESKQFLDGNMIFEFSRHFFLLYYIKIITLPLFRYKRFMLDEMT